MKAMVLAAGLGTRLRPLTDVFSKPMVPLVGRPCMEHTIRLLKKHGFEDIIVNLHHRPEKIKEHFGDGSQFGLKITYSYEKELLGTAGALKKVAGFFAGETVLIISGDALTDINLEDFYRHHKEQKAVATLALKTVDDPTQYGVVLLKEERIVAFQEKPDREEAVSNLANTGIYLFEPGIFEHIPAKTFFDFGKQVFPHLLQVNIKMSGYETSGYWCDIGDPAVYRQAHEDILAGRVKVDIPGKETQPGIWCGKDVLIDQGAELEAPLFLGEGCVIAKDVLIYGPTVIGSRCRLGTGAVIKKSILWDDMHINPGTTIDGRIVYQLRRGNPLWLP